MSSQGIDVTVEKNHQIMTKAGWILVLVVPSRFQFSHQPNEGVELGIH